MDTPTGELRGHLFNNPLFSDVKIKQIFDGKVREYYAHKAILCAENQYFLKLFTNNFKESSNPVVDICDDDPVLFELLLKHIYGIDYHEGIYELSGEDEQNRLLLAMGVSHLADKYDIPSIQEHVGQDFGSAIALKLIDDDLLRTFVTTHYQNVVVPGGPVGLELAHSVLERGETKFGALSMFVDLVMLHPVFGADIALALEHITTYGPPVRDLQWVS